MTASLPGFKPESFSWEMAWQLSRTPHQLNHHDPGRTMMSFKFDGARDCGVRQD
jgi:hypothetical protein